MAKRTPMRGWLRAAIACAALPSLGSCWWLESEPGPGEWRLRSGTIADFQPHNVASLYEADAFGQLLLECGQGPIAITLRPDRDLIMGDAIRLQARYRFDGNPPVAATALTSGDQLWFRDPQLAGSDEELVRQIGGARQLTIRIEWSATDRQTMRFDVSRAGPAIAWLRRECAEAAARRGG